MKAYEQKKEGSFQRGTVWMIVEGTKAEVQAVCAILDKDFDNDSCPDDNGKYGYSEGYTVDRSEKQFFMDCYKIAKKAIK